MEIRVELLTGKSITIPVDLKTTVYRIKETLFEKEGTLTNNQKLIKFKRA